MPEGHTIHRIARDHRKHFVGQSLKVTSPQGRFSNEAKKLSGKILQNIEAFGKHLFYIWSGGAIVHIHLGLYGKFRIHKNPPPEPRGQVRVRMIGKEKSFDLNGPNCCELINKPKMKKILERIGQDPLRGDVEPDLVWQRISKSRAPIGTLLLNQSVFAGVGNIFRAEALWVNHLSPQRLGKEISKVEFENLWQSITQMMKVGLKYNRIITVDLEVATKAPSRLLKNERLNIYKKEKCPSCNRKIKTGELAARKIYWCPKCQK